jgi:hypothetical protein
MEPLVGIEPTTYSLRVNCSTPELQRLLHSKSRRDVARTIDESMNLCNGAFLADPLHDAIAIFR